MWKHNFEGIAASIRSRLTLLDLALLGALLMLSSVLRYRP